jgi:hypothetical protein
MITFCGLDIKQVATNVRKRRNLTSRFINLSMTVDDPTRKRCLEKDESAIRILCDCEDIG